MRFINFLKQKNTIIWILNFVISVILLFAGYKITKNEYIALNSDGNAKKAIVTEITDKVESSYEVDGVKYITTEIYFKAKLENNDIVEVNQTIDEYSGSSKMVEINDKILIYESNGTYYFGDYIRINKIIFLLIIFCILIVLFGGFKGINTLVSLLFTCLAIFIFFLPSILSGFNIYLSAIITCIYIIITTLLFLNGMSQKTLTTILGCIFGVITAGVIFLIMNQILHLTGVTGEEELYLQMLEVKINLKAIIFAAIIISSMGAVMDVSMDIASSLYEIKKHKPNISFKELVKSGLNIGRDIMGTMSNTLILAFIGKSLTTTLLIVTYSSSLAEIFNKELVIIESLEALIGSISILLTAPITSIISSYIYTGKYKFIKEKIS
ncbi:MAG: YibE/F family protein [Bacilli bacterium]|nr:YibE/F family protein [Bacilli bacterium]